MIFSESRVSGAYLIDVERHSDRRGFFARAWCKAEFEAAGLKTDFVQANIAFNIEKGTVRGLHYQVTPHSEAKLVHCTRGAIYDVIVDLRADSPSYHQWLGVELTSENHRMLYVPEGCAHGYQTLTDDSEVFDLVTQLYAPDVERGIRYDDPAFHIEWPEEVQIISDKDRSWAGYSAELV